MNLFQEISEKLNLAKELNLKYSTTLARIHKNIKKDFILTNKVL